MTHARFCAPFSSARVVATATFVLVSGLSALAAAVPLVTAPGGGYGTAIISDCDDYCGGSYYVDVSSDIFADTGGLPPGIAFYGSYDGLWVNNNGNITFGNPTSDYTPYFFPGSDLPMIAPYFGDVDTRNDGTGAQSVYLYRDTANKRLLITWPSVGYYNTMRNRLNSFQLIITNTSDVCAGSFEVEFRYARLEWTTGGADGGSGGLGGNEAVAGFDSGNGVDALVLPGSGTPAVLDLINGSNVGEPGVWRFRFAETLSVCGNSRVENCEFCDDGNIVDGDGCTAQCVTEVCGDGIVQAARGEICDDGNTDDGDACPSDCVPAVCGDGYLRPSTEQCDDGNLDSGDGCSTSCKSEFCGDGLIQPGIGEACDDDNPDAGDGCSDICAIEEGYQCVGEPSVCTSDPDGDGLMTDEEDELGTDPNNADTDGDGLSDFVEVRSDRNTDPLIPDTDEDGLCDGPSVPADATCTAGEDLDADGVTDAGETDPTEFDTDNGGVGDGDEATDGTNPFDPTDDVGQDFDGDGLTNDREAEIGTDPASTDTDGDGLGDGVEVDGENPTNPLDTDTDEDGLCDGPVAVVPDCIAGEDTNADGGIDVGETDPNTPDTDADGIDDGDEINDGTDPLDPNDPGTDGDDGDSDAGGDTVDSDAGDGDSSGPTGDAGDVGGDASTGAWTPVGGGGCAAAPGAGRFPWAAALVGAALLGARRRRRVAVAVALTTSAAAPTAFADDGFDLQQFRPAPSQQANFVTVYRGTTLPQGGWEAGAIYNHAHRPLVLEDAEGNEGPAVVAAQNVINLLGAYGIADFFELGLDVPVNFAQPGDDVAAYAVGIDQPADTGFALGDIRVAPRFQIIGDNLGDEPGGISLSAALDTYLPTGSGESFTGGEFRVEPRVAVDYAFGDAAAIGANVGYVVRPESAFGGLGINDALSWALAADIAASEVVHVIGELSGEASVLAESVDSQELPLELLAAARYLRDEWTAQAGFGVGLVQGYGTPDWRLVLGLGYTGGVERAPDDTDLDGVFDDVDLCVTDPEDVDGWADADGCPDPDNDGDHILDAADTCRDNAEDPDGFEDTDGCPDRDNDNDGIIDASDDCTAQAEDPDGFEDDDGCPDRDNDGDNFADVADDCPLAAETLNDYRDGDGCPDEAPTLAAVEEGRIVILEPVFFETSSANIDARSFELLTQVAQIMSDEPQIRVRIEGHTDDSGSARVNAELSQARADSVRSFLIERGIDGDRLEAQGFGEEMPIADNTTEEGRATNRRVEFHILEQ